MMSASLLRTLFANRASDIAEAFTQEVGAARLEGPISYLVEMVVPDGPSTGGGRRSVQALRLVPLNSGNAIVFGTCDQIEMTASLRSWELLAEQYAQRFKGAKLPIDAVAYGRLLERVEAFFRQNVMRVERQDIDRAPVQPRPVLLITAPSLPWMIGLILAGAVLGASLTLAFR
jgi:hypothetical protein